VKKILLTILMGGLAMALFSCSKKTEPVPATPSGKPEGIWELGFTYDMFSGDHFMLEARVTDITPQGSRVKLEKRVGPMNYTGHTMSGDLDLDGEQTAALLEILGRYDIEGYSKLPRSGFSGAPSRTLIVFSGEDTWYVAFDAKFPETLPPQEDVMYMELYNFFNGLVRDIPDWQEVRSPDLEDPRENPAYQEGTAQWFGRTVRLVPGTGTYSEDRRGAKIDYGEEKWWLLEGFTGTWNLAESYGEEASHTSVSLEVGEDGSVTLILDGETWTGTLPDTRYYKEDTGFRLTNPEEGSRSFTCALLEPEDYTLLRIYAYPGPVPEPQFYPTDVVVQRR
jgi:hypothetical protein